MYLDYQGNAEGIEWIEWKILVPDRTIIEKKITDNQFIQKIESLLEINKKLVLSKSEFEIIIKKIQNDHHDMCDKYLDLKEKNQKLLPQLTQVIKF